MHYLLDNSQKDGKSFIPARFVQQFFRKEKWNLKDVCDILYNNKFINRVEEHRSHRGFRYYHIFINGHTLKAKDLSVYWEYRYNTYKHYLDTAETIPFQKVMDYTMIIGFKELEEGLQLWKEEAKDKRLDKNFEAEDVWNQMLKHNNEVRYGFKNWSKDEFGGRRYHFLARMPEFLRHYIKDHSNTIEVDISQCFPVLLALIEEQYNSFDNEYSKLFWDPDFDFYLFLCPEDREKGKDEFYNLLFGYLESARLKELLPAFNERIQDIRKYSPELIGINKTDPALRIEGQLKWSGGKLIKEKVKWEKLKSKFYPYYKSISLSCARKEVKIFEKIWAYLLKMDIWFLPIHDGILCQKEDSEIIQGVVSKFLKEEFADSRIKYKIREKK
jgi:hypothetical protein